MNYNVQISKQEYEDFVLFYVTEAQLTDTEARRVVNNALLNDIIELNL